MSVGWVDVFVDRPRPQVDAAASFWAQVAGCEPSAWRAGHTFATLVPAGGEAYLRVQAVDHLGARGGGHLDLRVTDPVAEGARLRGLGATGVSEGTHLVVLRSPAGLTFCLTPTAAAHAEAVRPPPAGAPTSRVDQVTLDLPASVFEREGDFWASVTGWDLLGAGSGEFRVLRAPGWGSRVPGAEGGGQPGPPVRLLLQRLDEPDGPAGMHLDLACADRTVTAVQHVALGARVDGHGRRWTVMRDPTGSPYCLTDRDPRTGALPT